MYYTDYKLNESDMEQPNVVGKVVSELTAAHRILKWRKVVLPRLCPDFLQLRDSVFTAGLWRI